MRGLRQRLEALEGATRVGWDAVHRVIQEVGQSRDEALDVYGREKIGSNDLTLIVRLVAPVHDAGGIVIPQPLRTVGLKATEGKHA